MSNCPCGSLKKYQDCCAEFIAGKKSAPTPEALMRSRYTAFTQNNTDYIAQTMLPPAANNFDPAAAREWEAKITWEKLEVISSSMQADIGYVEFIAYFSEDNKQQVLHELSEFHFQDGKWFYTDGKKPRKPPVTNTQLVGRNDLCPCGSGKKFKKCCL